MRLTLYIEPQAFAKQLATEVMRGTLSIADTIESLTASWLETSVERGYGARLKKAPRATVHPHYFRDRFVTLDALSKGGYSTWYPEVRFATNLDDEAGVTEVAAQGFEHGYIQYGGGIYRDHQYFRKELKTQISHTVRLNQVTIPPAVFADSIDFVKKMGTIEQPLIANLTAAADLLRILQPAQPVNNLRTVNPNLGGLPGFRVVAFDHVVTGVRRFCLCHRPAHNVMLSAAKAKAPSYALGSWPHRVIDTLEGAVYEQGLCHFCVGQRHGADVAKKWYGNSVHTLFGPYVDLLMLDTQMDIRTATAETKRRLSINRWVREEEVYNLVRKIFPTQTILRHASPQWLGLQSLDIYLPELSLAIEHQGEQHYAPVEAFGGEDAFVKVKERDERKRELCRQNGISIVEVRFDHPLTIPILRSRLGRWLNP